MFTLDPFAQTGRHFVSNISKKDKKFVLKANKKTGNHVEWSDTPNQYADPKTHGSINSDTIELKEFWEEFNKAKASR